SHPPPPPRPPLFPYTTLFRSTNHYGIVLIFDEVITGFRVDYGGAQSRYGIVPDLTCLGKIIGGGLPVGVYGGLHKIMRLIAPERSEERRVGKECRVRGGR